MEIAKRIMHCTQCDYLWVRKRKAIPDRCPKCHKRSWDRPLLSALMLAGNTTPSIPASQYNSQPHADALDQAIDRKETT